MIELTNPSIASLGGLFPTIYGRNLIGELANFVHRPFLVVTMEDLWERFAHHFDGAVAQPYLVTTIDGDELEREVAALPPCNAIVGLGGGQAVDVAKFFAWSLRLPLFQVPTSMSVNAPFGHRAGLRFGGNVRYMGWAVPQAVYVDFDVIQSAPPLINRSGVCEIFCYHTAHADWRLAHVRGKTESKWPFDEALVAEAKSVLDLVMSKLDDIHAVNEEGIRTLMNANRWGGAAFHNAGWNPRHIEGIDHFLFYALEYYTGKKFIHGQPVCLGIYAGSLLHGERADEMLEAIHRVGVDIRPEAMGISWDDVGHALMNLSGFVRQAGLWYGIAHEATITDAFVNRLREAVTEKFGS
ncbi:MAG: iron-containing alcohol dehydrogenase [Trueperaceae bacterium]|nr:MAG: iron-containing alcohol dehydrogenase [Trueperaceae bacterium]